MPTSMENMVLICTAALAVLVLLWTFLRFQTGAGARPLLRGLGVILALVGLYLSGMTLLIGNGIRSIYDWAHRTHMSTTMIIGFSLIGAGLLFWLIGTLIRPRTKDDRRAVRATKKGATPVSSAPRTSGATTTATTDEDREVEELLNKRGIS